MNILFKYALAAALSCALSSAFAVSPPSKACCGGNKYWVDKEYRWVTQERCKEKSPDSDCSTKSDICKAVGGVVENKTSLCD